MVGLEYSKTIWIDIKLTLFPQHGFGQEVMGKKCPPWKSDHVTCSFGLSLSPPKMRASKNWKQFLFSITALRLGLQGEKYKINHRNTGFMVVALMKTLKIFQI